MEMEYLVGGAAFIVGVGALFLLVRTLARVVFGRSRRLERDLAIGVLRDRLARDEITQRQFDEAVSTVGNG